MRNVSRVAISWAERPPLLCWLSPVQFWFAEAPCAVRATSAECGHRSILLAYRKPLRLCRHSPQRSVELDSSRDTRNTCPVCKPPGTVASIIPTSSVWHRMYLYWFERIIRKMSGEPCWHSLLGWAPALSCNCLLRSATRNRTVHRESQPCHKQRAVLSIPAPVSISGAFSSADSDRK